MGKGKDGKSSKPKTRSTTGVRAASVTAVCKVMTRARTALQGITPAAAAAARTCDDDDDDDDSEDKHGSPTKKSKRH